MDITTYSIDDFPKFGDSIFLSTTTPELRHTSDIPTNNETEDGWSQTENQGNLEDASTWAPNYTDIDDITAQVDALNNKNWHVFMYYLIGTTGMLDNGFVILIIMLRKSMRTKVSWNH